MKTAILSLSVFLNFSAFAAASPQTQFTCHFTEPFVTAVYQPELFRLTLSEDVMNQRTVLHAVSLRQNSAVSFDLLNKENRVVLKLTREPASNGMSDLIYPYAGELYLHPNSGPHGTLHGGCFTPAEPVKDPNN